MSLHIEWVCINIITQVIRVTLAVVHIEHTLRQFKLFIMLHNFTPLSSATDEITSRNYVHSFAVTE